MFKNKRLIVMLLFVLSFFFLSTALEWPLSWILGLYAVIIAILCITFKAGTFYFLANISHSVGKRERSKEFFLRAINHGSKNPLCYVNYAVLNMQDQNAAVALEYAEKALAMNPDEVTDKNARLTISSAHWILGDTDKAIQALEAMREKYEYVGSQVLTSLGFLYLIKGDTPNAKLATEKALEDSPSSGAAWDNMGQIYLREGDKEKAEESFQKALSFKDNLVDSAYLLARIYEEAGKKELAAEYFIRAKGCSITRLNTVTQEMVDEKYDEYINIGYEDDYEDDYEDGEDGES